MKPTGEPVEEILAGISDERRRAGALILCGLMREISGEEPTVWASRIIGFGRYHYRYESGHEGHNPLISFAPQANQFAIYLIGGYEQRHHAQLSRLGTYKTGKGCLYIKRLSDVDLDALRVLLDRSVRVRRGVDRASGAH